MAEDCLLEAVRGLRLAHPELGPKPLVLAKLRELRERKRAFSHEAPSSETASCVVVPNIVSLDLSSVLSTRFEAPSAHPFAGTLCALNAPVSPHG